MDLFRWSCGHLLHLLFPPACALCHTTLPAGWIEPWCQTCLHGLHRLPAARCSLCCQPFAGVSAYAHLCSRCLQVPPAYSAVYSVGLYEESLQTAIRLFKFNKRVNLDRSLAYYMSKELPSEAGFDLIIPVPLHSSALRARSYNQATLLARELGRLLACRVDTRVLRKIRKTLPQHNLAAKEREGNLHQAFSVVIPLAGEHVLLVDDVLTTGATVASCTQSLLAGGAAKVSVVTVARAG